LPAATHRRPAFPEARACEPFQSGWSYSSPRSTVFSSACRAAGSYEISVHQCVGLRQILQCVGQIRTGSPVHTLNQTSDLRRHGKLHGAMPTLFLSPSSRSQFSGASWIGSQLLGIASSPVSADRRVTLSQMTKQRYSHANCRAE
jgi:hypothetical protein